jgi:hypothetical protein
MLGGAAQKCPSLWKEKLESLFFNPLATFPNASTLSWSPAVKYHVRQ